MKRFFLILSEKNYGNSRGGRGGGSGSGSGGGGGGGGGVYDKHPPEFGGLQQKCPPWGVRIFFVGFSPCLTCPLCSQSLNKIPLRSACHGGRNFLFTSQEHL